MMTQAINMYTPPKQLGTRRVFQPFPVHISKVATLEVGLAVTGTSKYLHPERVPADTFAPPEFNFIRMLDIP